MAHTTERCPVRVHRNYQSVPCGKPVKENGKCGVHAARAAENYAAPQDLAWFGWINAAEQACGHSLDGDQSTDGYSMDGAYAAFLEGKTIGQYLAQIEVRA